jgi:hypothetical protein
MKNLSKHLTPPQDRAQELLKELAREIAFFVGSRERLITDVGADGKAVSARTPTGFIANLTPLCKTWQYKPFERNGQPIAAKVRESVAILPIGERHKARPSAP